MIENFSDLIVDIEKGDETDAFEAAKAIAYNKLSKVELLQLSRIVTTGVQLYNKEAAIYAFYYIDNRSFALSILIDTLSSLQNHERARGRAAEGIGLIKPSRKFKCRMHAEEILLKRLNDSSPTVRFWSCYAVGELKMKNALPALNELHANDVGICPGWWYVLEEAEDAIAKINDREWKDRIPINLRR